MLTDGAYARRTYARRTLLQNSNPLATDPNNMILASIKILLQLCDLNNRQPVKKLAY
jgi:hypothetical protein